MVQRGSIAITYLSVVATLFSGCVAKNVVTQVPPPHSQPAKMNGVFYALPRTVIVVSVPIKKTHADPGEFCEFAHCFFPGETVIKKEEETYSVGTPTFSTRSEPDPSKVFMVKIQGHYFEDKTLQMDLTESGVMTKGEAESKSQALEFVTKTVKTAISIGAKAAQAGLQTASVAAERSFRETLSRTERACFDEAVQNLNDRKEALRKECREIVAKLEALETKSEALEEARNKHKAANQTPVTSDEKASKERKETIQKAESDLIRVTDEFTKAETAYRKAITDAKDPVIQQKLPALALALDKFEKAQAKVDNFKKAKEIFNRIGVLHGQRDALLSTAASQMPPDTLKTILKELDDTIAILQSKFLGSSKDEEPWKPIFELRLADGDNVKTEELFKLSKTDGICLSPGFQHIVVPVGFHKDGAKCDRAMKVCLWTDRINTGQLADTVNAASLKVGGERGFYYRIPGLALARLQVEETKDGNTNRVTNEVGRDTLAIAQLGTLVSLPASSNGRTTKYSLALYENSGALKNFNLGSSALVQNALLEDVQAAGTSINELRAKLGEARAKEQAGAAAKEDELEKLKRKAAILELQLQIKQLEEKLGIQHSP